MQPWGKSSGKRILGKSTIGRQLSAASKRENGKREKHKELAE